MLRPSASAEVAAAVSDCWRAVGANGVDPRRLTASGWSVVRDAAGTTTQAPLDVYTKPGADDRIMLPRAPDAPPLCAVIARVSSPSQGPATLTAIERSLRAIDPNVRSMRDDQGLVFFSGPTFALIDELDSDYVTKEQPGLRITVGYKIAEKK